MRGLTSRPPVHLRRGEPFGPTWKLPETAAWGAGREQALRSFLQWVGGLTGLALGPGGRERSVKTLEPYIKPIFRLLETPYLGLAPQQAPLEELRGALRLTTPGRVSKRYFESVARQLLPYFEERTGLLRPAASGYGRTMRMRILNAGIRSGLLPEFRPGASRTEAAMGKQKLSYLLQTIGALEEAGEDPNKWLPLLRHIPAPDWEPWVRKTIGR